VALDLLKASQQKKNSCCKFCFEHSVHTGWMWRSQVLFHDHWWTWRQCVSCKFAAPQLHARIGLVKTSFCHGLTGSKWHSASWIHAIVDAVHVESFWKVTGSNLNGRKDSVNSHDNEPSATRQSTLRPCGVSPTALKCSTICSHPPTLNHRLLRFQFSVNCCALNVALQSWGKEREKLSNEQCNRSGSC